MTVNTRVLLLICVPLGSLAAQSLQITSPAGGTVVNPGQTVTVNVSGSGSFQQVAIIGQSPIGVSQQVLNSPPYQFTVQVPTTINPGQYMLAAMAPVEGVNSDPVLIDVERSDNPGSLTVMPPILNLRIGHLGYLQTNGMFAGGAGVQLNQSTLLTYTSDTPTVAAVNSQGIVTPVAPGSANITASYGSESISVPVTVPPYLAIAPESTALYASQTEQFTPQPTAGSSPSITWSIAPTGAGTIDSTGLYSAPPSISAQQTFNVIATNAADSTQFATATINLYPPVSITAITPSAASLTSSQTQQFTATLANAVNAGVTWSLSPSGAGTVGRTGLYTAPASIPSQQTVTLTATSWTDPTASGSAIITLNPSAASPTFSPAAGTYTSAQSVTISTATPGASIRYTTDGSTPSETAGTLYSGPVIVGNTTTINAIAYAGGFTDSAIASAAYTIAPVVAPPTFSPAAGTYASTQSVTIGTTTSGAAIRYTTDGSTPSETAGTLYSGPITVSSTTTINAIAYAAGMTDSSVATATYSFSSSGGGNGYSYSRSITIAHAHVPNTDQTNFPFLFNTTDALLATTPNGGHVTNANGYDIIFTSDAAGTQPLNYEIESYNPTTGQLIAWVQIPTVSHSADTVIYLFYGNSSITTSQQNQNGVWNNNYVGVWHLPNGTTLSTNDSTSNAYNGTNSSASATTGQIDGAANFVAANSADIGLGQENFGSTMTVSAWFKTSASTGGALVGNANIPVGPGAVGTYDGLLFVNTSNQLAGGVYNGSGPPLTSSVTVNDGQWHYAVWATNAATQYLYLDGNLLTSASAGSPGSLYYSIGTAYTGGWAGTNNSWFYFNGSIDEVRFSTSASSADWIATEYNNQSSPSTFYALGSESGGGGTGSITATGGAMQSTVIGTAFATALQATVKDASNNPVSGVIVTFMAPGSGATAAFNGSTTATATTDSSGVATAPTLTANATTGSYTVAASVAGLATSANFSLTNTSGGGNGYSYSRSITIAHTQVPNTDQTNFPFLFNTTDALLATTANGGHVTDVNGYDIIFTSDAAGTQQLKHEIESYNPTTGQLIAWVQIPTVSHSADTVIYLFYGNSSVTTSQQNQNGVWSSNYAGVWHLPNGATLSANDSTSNAYNGTNSSASATTGQIDGAANFVAANSADIGLGQENFGNTMTVSAWFKISTSTGGAVVGNANTPVGSGGVGSYNGLLFVNTSNQLAGGVYNGSGPPLTSSVTVNDGQWHYAVWATNGTTQYLYLDGNLLTSASAGGVTNWYYSIGTAYTAGWAGTNSSWFYFDGSIDEVRFSTSASSADWIATEYNNQSSPSTFYALGSESVH